MKKKYVTAVLSTNRPYISYTSTVISVLTNSCKNGSAANDAAITATPMPRYTFLYRARRAIDLAIIPTCKRAVEGIHDSIRHAEFGQIENRDQARHDAIEAKIVFSQPDDELPFALRSSTRAHTDCATPRPTATFLSALPVRPPMLLRKGFRNVPETTFMPASLDGCA